MVKKKVKKLKIKSANKKVHPAITKFVKDQQEYFHLKQDEDKAGSLVNTPPPEVPPEVVKLVEPFAYEKVEEVVVEEPDPVADPKWYESWEAFWKLFE
jgi:hypothetical protein